jgi:hypothetical protein
MAKPSQSGGSASDILEEGFGRCHTGPPFDLLYSKHPGG